VKVLLDTGPIVALLNRRDQYHDWARSAAGQLDAPLHTCEAVLAEAHHLLSGVHDGSTKLNALVASWRCRRTSLSHASLPSTKTSRSTAGSGTARSTS
jgi:predicted nucleic acid-binding protein